MRFLIRRRCFFNSAGGRPWDSREAKAAKSSASSLGLVGREEEDEDEEEAREEGVEAEGSPRA